jgi:hypothetical protein
LHGILCMSCRKMPLHHGPRHMSCWKMPLRHGPRHVSCRKMPLRHGHDIEPCRKMPLRHGHDIEPCRKMPLRHGHDIESCRKMPLGHGNISMSWFCTGLVMHPFPAALANNSHEMNMMYPMETVRASAPCMFVHRVSGASTNHGTRVVCFMSLIFDPSQPYSHSQGSTGFDCAIVCRVRPQSLAVMSVVCTSCFCTTYLYRTQ